MDSKNICKFVIGDETNKLKIANFVYESDYNTMSNPNKNIYNRAILIKKGRGTFYADGTAYDYNTGCIIFSFADEEIYFKSEEECEFFYISFEGERAQVLFLRFDINKQNRIFHGFDGLIPMWHESVSGSSKDNIDLAAESVLLYSLSRFKSSSHDKNHIIDQITDITQKSFSDPNLSIEKIAEKLNYNPKYLSHTFKKHINISFSEYLRNIRIKYAVSLFDHGIDSVKNVAYLSGFKDPLYFSTVFKKTIGVSPKEYTEKTIR